MSKKKKDPAREEKIFKKLAAIISEILAAEEGKVTKEADFIKDLNADSLDSLEIIMAVEDAFNIEISEEEAEKITNVRNALDYLVKNSDVDVD